MDLAYWLYKLATKALLPLPVLLVLLAIGLIFLRRIKLLAGTLVLVSLTLLITLSLPVTARTLLRSLEQQHPPMTITEIPNADLIVLLTGGVDLAVAPRTHAELGARGDRILTALRLLQANKAPRLLVAGKNSKATTDTPSEGDATIAILSAMGVEPSRLSAISRGRNTRETAVELAAQLAAEGIERVLLVTSAYHMPRSMLLVAELAPTVIPVTANHLITDNHTVSLLDWIPSAISLSGSTLAINEYLGMWVTSFRD